MFGKRQIISDGVPKANASNNCLSLCLKETVLAHTVLPNSPLTGLFVYSYNLILLNQLLLVLFYYYL